MKMFPLGDIAVRMSDILYIRRSWESLGLDTKYIIEIKLKLELKPVKIQFNTERERDIVYETLLEQIEEGD